MPTGVQVSSALAVLGWAVALVLAYALEQQRRGHK